MNLAATFFVVSAIPLAILAGLVGLAVAFYLIKSILAASPGTDKMQQIAKAVQEGAQAYLNRQIITISAIASVIFVLLWILKGFSTSLGFLIGAVCSMAAGYVGMRIAVLANVRPPKRRPTDTSLRSKLPSMAVRSLGCWSSRWRCWR